MLRMVDVMKIVIGNPDLKEHALVTNLTFSIQKTQLINIAVK